MCDSHPTFQEHVCCLKGGCTSACLSVSVYVCIHKPTSGLWPFKSGPGCLPHTSLLPVTHQKQPLAGWNSAVKTGAADFIQKIKKKKKRLQNINSAEVEKP